MSDDVKRGVLQVWVESIPWKQQSILISGMRGPDVGNVPAIKSVNRWMRIVSQQNADPSKNYMMQAPLPTPADLCAELEWLPCHYVHHFADALAVIGYHHPSMEIRRSAYAFHAHIAEELFHFLPEQPWIFNWRHRDKTRTSDMRKPPSDRTWMDALLPPDYIHA